MENIGRFALSLLLLVPGALPAQPSPGPNWQRPEVKARIDFTNYDRGLMAAAIFHETNRVRRQLQLRLILHLPKLDEAADLQASMGSFQLELSHRNPVPSLADVIDRVRSVGLKPLVAAENIALTATLDADPKTTSVVPRQEGGGPRFYDARTGRKLEAMSYAGFAAAVVRLWMESPGHRANVVNPELDFLGCSARWRKEYTGVDLLYSVQVFVTPLPGT
ncbi:MAG: CAP domain-containing protein [Lacunisphaera sp.]|nr:CAP domain-containing protein [Lacunisphaera sp.]